MAASDDLLGWVPSPNRRGTMDIIWGCSSTIFLLTWVMLHLNVPSHKDSDTILFFRKTKWFIATLLAPEVVMLFAGGEWAAARRSVEEMHQLGLKDWTMIHAFYAESGGFKFYPRDSTSFPITAHQLAYLIREGHVDMSTVTRITTEDISDKSKADKFAKLLALLQGGWFIIQIIGRRLEQLPITLLELSTLCLMTCTITTLFFWFYKPLDVETSTPLYSARSTNEIVALSGKPANTQYKYTPLDFCELTEYTSPQSPFYHMWRNVEKPLSQIRNDRDPLLHSWKILAIILLPTAAFGTVQLAAWKYTFPTRAEQLLWRYTCLGGIAVLGTWTCFEAVAVARSKYTLPTMQTYNGYKTRWPWCMIFYVGSWLYFIGRMAVIAEVIISLRALPPGCFENVQWTGVLPHV